MKKIYFPLLIVFVATLTACGSSFEWFPKVADTTGPTVSATVGGRTFANNTTYHSTIPVTVTLTGTDTASTPVTIYYTTNNSEPTTSSSSFTGSGSVSITDYAWVLKFLGYDSISNKSSTITLTFKP